MRNVASPPLHNPLQDHKPDDEQEDEYIAPSQLRDDAEEEESGGLFLNLQTNRLAEQPKYQTITFGVGEVQELPQLMEAFKKCEALGKRN